MCFQGMLHRTHRCTGPLAAAVSVAVVHCFMRPGYDSCLRVVIPKLNRWAARLSQLYCEHMRLWYGCLIPGPAVCGQEEGYTVSFNAYDLSAGVFVRGLTNVKAQLSKAEDHAAVSGSGEAAILNARLATGSVASNVPTDLHMYTLSAHVHWAAEGARVALAHVLGAPAVPAANDAKSFADLHQRLDGTIAYLRDIAASDVEAGLNRTIVIERPRGSMHSNGSQFLLAFAIPHFFYHTTTAYGILRNQGVRLTMGDFLGNWMTS